MQYDHGFKEGDHVRLRTGGPLMSVEMLLGNLVLCTWFDAGGRARRGTYSWEELQAAATVGPVWLGVLQRLSERWTVVAATH